jgi:hypothetical protein
MKKIKLKLWHKILLGILIFIVLLLFAAPRIARYYIVKNSYELIGRKLDIRKIRLNYFSGTVRIKGLTLYEQDGQTNFVSFNKLLVNMDYWPLIQRELRIAKIHLDHFYAQVEQKGDWFNFSDLIAESDSQDTQTEPEDTTVNAPMTFTINNITISNSSAQYTDLLLNHNISLDDINLYIPGFSFSSEATNLAVDFDFIQGGSLYSSLNYNQVDSLYAINLKLDSLNLAIVEPYIKSSIDISTLRGYFSNNIYLKGNLQHIMQIEMSGWNRIEELEILDLQNRRVLSFDKFSIDIDTLLLTKNEIRINEIDLVNPYILFELIDTTNNWSAMIIPADSTTSDTIEKTEEAADFVYSIARLELQNGKVDFKDQTLTRDFGASIQNIYIKSKDVDINTREVAFQLSAELNRTAEIKTDLVLNPMDMNDIDIDFSLQKFAMKDIEPYMQDYFGYPVESGFLNFSSSTSMTSDAMTSENNLYVRQFELGKPDKKDAEYKLPLRLAIGVLSDKDGIIELNIPVTTKGEETRISNLGKLIFRTIGNLIVKAATSPVNLLAGMYNVDPEKLRVVKIGMFENMPGEEDMEALDLLADILKDKPKLNLELAYNIDSEKYFDSLASQLAIKEYMKATGNYAETTAAEVSDSIIISFMTKKLAEKQISADTSMADLCIEYIGKELLTSRFDSTKQKHIDFIYDYMLSNKLLSQDRISIYQESPDSIPVNRTHGIFIVRFKSTSPDDD